MLAYELNISCPNVERGGLEYGANPELIKEVVGAARQAAKRPLWVKLSPTVGIIGLTAKAAESAGADAVVIANTYPALCLDSHNRRVRLGSTTGGLSGPAIKPITIRLVYEASRVIQIPIIGVGGIESPTDVAEYLVAGASAVESWNGTFCRRHTPRRSLVRGLEKWCLEENLLEISKLRGSLKVNRRWPKAPVIYKLLIQIRLGDLPMRAKILFGLQSVFLGLGLLVLTPSVNPTTIGSASNPAQGANIASGECEFRSKISSRKARRIAKPLAVWQCITGWYGEDFDGQPTANGETYDMYATTAAHPTLPLGSIVRVVNTTQSPQPDRSNQ